MVKRQTVSVATVEPILNVCCLPASPSVRQKQSVCWMETSLSVSARRALGNIPTVNLCVKHVRMITAYAFSEKLKETLIGAVSVSLARLASVLTVCQAAKMFFVLRCRSVCCPAVALAGALAQIPR